jgi:uncharacterized protein with NRDE domain
MIKIFRQLECFWHEDFYEVDNFLSRKDNQFYCFQKCFLIRFHKLEGYNFLYSLNKKKKYSKRTPAC